MSAPRAHHLAASVRPCLFAHNSGSTRRRFSPPASPARSRARGTLPGAYPRRLRVHEPPLWRRRARSPCERRTLAPHAPSRRECAHIARRTSPPASARSVRSRASYAASPPATRARAGENIQRSLPHAACNSAEIPSVSVSATSGFVGSALRAAERAAPPVEQKRDDVRVTTTRGVHQRCHPPRTGAFVRVRAAYQRLDRVESTRRP